MGRDEIITTLIVHKPGVREVRVASRDRSVLHLIDEDFTYFFIRSQVGKYDQLDVYFMLQVGSGEIHQKIQSPTPIREYSILRFKGD